MSLDRNETLGLIGVGRMGMGMLINLLKRFQVYIFDINKERVRMAVEKGAKEVESLEQLVGYVDHVILSLPGPDEVRSVVNELLSYKFNGTIIDTSTIDPDTSEEMFEKSSDRGVKYIAAPVSGGEKGAQRGELSIFVGAPEHKGTKLDEILHLIGKNIFYVNSPKIASAIKLINNLMTFGNFFVATEALALAKAESIPLDVIYNAISTSSGYSRSYELRWKNYVSVNNYEPGFSIKLVKKDINLMIKMAKKHNLSLIIPHLLLYIFEHIPQDESKDYGLLMKIYLDYAEKGDMK
jgi:3-hydroxyisobutyrate dehydrogenase